MRQKPLERHAIGWVRFSFPAAGRGRPDTDGHVAD